MTELRAAGREEMVGSSWAVSIDDYVSWWQPLASQEPISCRYANAATCPECDSSMIRQGSCCSCPSCGFASCGG